jgi:hypothetical protein|tara:strand:- start:813 stop:1064 length:252 start_codon:yes stop_codon:yes gene_type:complete
MIDDNTRPLRFTSRHNVEEWLSPLIGSEGFHALTSAVADILLKEVRESGLSPWSDDWAPVYARYDHEDDWMSLVSRAYELTQN